MELHLIYWILMLIWAIFAIAWNLGGSFVGNYGPLGNSVLLFALFLILGWKVFGPPIHG